MKFLPKNQKQARNLLLVGSILFTGTFILDFRLDQAVHNGLPSFIIIPCVLSSIVFIVIGSIGLIKLSIRDAPGEVRRLDQNPALQSITFSALPTKKMLRNHHQAMVILGCVAAGLFIFPCFYIVYLIDPNSGLSAKSELLTYMTVIAVAGIIISGSISLYLHTHDKTTRINMLVQLSHFTNDNQFTMQRPGSIDEITSYAKIYRPLIRLPFTTYGKVPYSIRGSYLDSPFMLATVLGRYPFGIATYNLPAPLSVDNEVLIRKLVDSMGDLIAKVRIVDASLVLETPGVLDTDYYSMARYFEVFAYAHNVVTKDVHTTI